MSERYVKDIFEKLEEIEKLHAKLRSLVPRVKNHEAEKVSINAQKTSESTNNNQSKGNGRDSSKTNNLKNGSPNGKWRKLSSNSANFVSKQWHGLNDRIKYLLSTIKERDILLVNRAAQTSDDDRSEGISRRQSIAGSPEIESREDRLHERRRHKAQRVLDRLLEHFNYSRDPKLGDRVSMQQDHHLGSSEPHRVKKAMLLPDQEAQTLKVVSSAQNVSIDDNRESYSGKRSPNNRAQTCFRTYAYCKK
ncbi:uncharacterized protein LOC143372174 isoform X2 [Andrena cerasifolii]|uniref:uncharacterized protein LOC143372174 isoform X2 n=1 Tax=Andrena cerasifolii TaxID=2819439 RepID=UPI0040381B62